MIRAMTTAVLAVPLATAGCLDPYIHSTLSRMVAGPARSNELCQVIHPPTGTSTSMYRRCTIALDRARMGNEQERLAAQQTVHDWAIARERYRHDPNRFHPGLPGRAQDLSYFVGGRVVTCRTVGPDIECG